MNDKTDELDTLDLPALQEIYDTMLDTSFENGGPSLEHQGQFDDADKAREACREVRAAFLAHDGTTVDLSHWTGQNAPIVETTKSPPSEPNAEKPAETGAVNFNALTTTAELVEAHNKMLPEAEEVGIKNAGRMKNFISLETGVKACERLRARIDKTRAAGEKPAAKTKGESTEGDTNMAAKKAKKTSIKKKAAAPKKAAVTKTPRTPKKNGDVRKGSKTEIVKKLLSRASGCTSKEILEATGWPSVSVPAMSKACGLKLTKEKLEGKPTRYFGK